MKTISILLSLIPAALSISVAAAPAPAAAQEPWTLLETVRASVAEAGPMSARFVQTYVPAGFSSGEKESGELAIALPDCLRFDYQEPYQKSFLLCGDTAHYWNRDDKTGRRYAVDRSQEPGLDLVLLGQGDLETRYEAVAKGAGDGRTAVTLTPKGERRELASATLTIDRGSRRLVELSYSDLEGNRTHFTITGYRAIRDGARFQPPKGIEWREE